MDGERVPVVVLDPGHGGTARIGGSSSNNAVGPDGTLEKDVALDLASRTAGLLSGSARTILTRTTDANLSLADRAAVARANHADVFVSIHLNGFHDPGVDGTEVWIARAASQASADLAREVLDRLVAVTGVADRGVRRADLGVLVPARHDPATAACLAEIAFLTNPAQSARLSTDAYRQQIAQALTTAVLNRIRVPAAVGAPLSVSAPQTGAGATILSNGNGNGNGHHDGPSDARMLAAAIGGYGATAPPRSIGLDATTLGYGVPGGTITDGFYRDATERQAVTGRTGGRSRHLGIDVSLSNVHGGGATDDRRGLPVYATPKAVIDLADLNGVRVARNDETLTGLGIDGQGAARLQHAIVLAQPWSTQDDSAYGGVVGLACRYAYTRTAGSVGTFTLYLEYLHLITPAFLPKDGQGRTISGQAWEATGKGIGFGPRIRNGDVLTAADLTGGDPVLIGYLGATQFPHVHIQAAFASGEQRYLRVPRFDPAVMLQASSTTQSLAAGPSLTFNDRSFTYDVPGTVEPLVSPTPALCWATVATMLVSWRDQQPHPITMV
ncbi:MAG: lysozyme, partial [Actinomycetota bacterium]|nr:lysozyme [Actinomycetota bacterium]